MNGDKEDIEEISREGIKSSHQAESGNTDRSETSVLPLVAELMIPSPWS